MDINKLRKQEIAKIYEEVFKTRKKIVEKRTSLKISKEKNTNLVKKMKKDLARMLTVIVEKEVLNEQKNP